MFDHVSCGKKESLYPDRNGYTHYTSSSKCIALEHNAKSFEQMLGSLLSRCLWNVDRIVGWKWCCGLGASVSSYERDLNCEWMDPGLCQVFLFHCKRSFLILWLNGEFVKLRRSSSTTFVKLRCYSSPRIRIFTSKISSVDKIQRRKGVVRYASVQNTIHRDWCYVYHKISRVALCLSANSSRVRTQRLSRRHRMLRPLE